MLPVKRQGEIIPTYSLTADLLSYVRCGMQYRYQNGSALPPSRPVQMWFGQFIHGVMEGAFRLWALGRPNFPWPCTHPTFNPEEAAPTLPDYDIGRIGTLVEAALASSGMSPRNRNIRDIAYRRAERAVNLLGPHLFPLVQAAEEKVISTRPIPRVGNVPLRAVRYEVEGVMDVLSRVGLAQASGNLIVDAVIPRLGGLREETDIILDYKGAERPATDHPYWDQGEWQVQTYSWLRSRQQTARPIGAGILLYINELFPTEHTFDTLKTQCLRGTTDVAPAPGSHDALALADWRRGQPIPNLSEEFRIARAIRVIPIDQASQAHALAQFDDIVVRIESSIAHESQCGSIERSWVQTGDENTCEACDFRSACPGTFRLRGTNRKPPAPQAP